MHAVIVDFEMNQKYSTRLEEWYPWEIIEIGAVKPDERAYLAALQRLGSMAEESLFIDDQARNVEAAREVGMEAILFKDYQSLCRELGNYGILTS